MMCQFLLYNKVNQLYVYIYPHISSLLRLPPTLPIPSLQVVTKHQADLPVLCNCFPLAIYFFFKQYLFIYLFIFGCVGSSFLCEGFLQVRRAGATLHRGARASHCRGLSCCGAQAPDVQAQQLWLTGLVTSRHVGSSQTRARTRVPCIGRQILNHCTTREAPSYLFYIWWCIYVHATLSLGPS